MLIQFVVRTVGPILLRGGLGGGGGTGTSNSRNNIDDDFDDFDDDDSNDAEDKSSEKVNISLPTSKPDSDSTTTDSARINLLDSNDSTSTQTPSQTTEDDFSLR